jgi:hypothetical protein
MRETIYSTHATSRREVGAIKPKQLNHQNANEYKRMQPTQPVLLLQENEKAACSASHDRDGKNPKEVDEHTVPTAM